MLRNALERLTSLLHDYQYFRMKTETHIRLLTLLPGLPQDALRAKLTTVDLADQDDPSFPLYECLSYAWGDTSERATIYVDNHVISVTKNLAEALMHFRHHDLPRVMWIDALCINQGDMAERSLQVALMSRIYTRAQRVNVWLGPATRDSELAMKTMIEISKTVDLDLTTQSFKSINDPGNWATREMQLPLTSEQIDAVCNLLKRSWFQRLWVWQEIRLGSLTSLVIAGYNSMLWFRFYVAAFFLRWKREFGLGPRFFEVERHIESINGMMNNITQSPMASLALRTCHSHCSEPKDRVYALMGITTDEVDITPDYSLSISDVYKDRVLQQLVQLANLELLSSCRLRESSTDLPSWVPDWRIPNDRFRFFDLDGAGQHPADATYISPATLEVSVVYVDTIDSVQQLPFTGSDAEIVEALKNLSPAETANKPYLMGGTTSEAYCRTLLANQFAERYLPSADLLIYPTFSAASEVLSPQSQSEPPAIARFVQNYKLQATGRSFATTSKGYYALVPDETQKHDEILHVLGCRWPVVLRPHKNEYRVVGNAYVNGDDDREILLGPLSTSYRGIAHYDASTAKWWPMVYNVQTKETQIDDPRLGPLPQGWSIKSHPEDTLWHWYVKEGADDADLLKMKTEKKWRSDPRLTVEALKRRGVDVQKFKLI